LESLEDLVLLSTVNWTNAAGGDWDTPGNWSTNTLPTVNDDVVINESGNVTITHSKNATDSVKSVTAGNPITLSGGTLTVSGSLSDTSTINLAGGTLANAKVASGTTLQANRSTGGLIAVTLAGTLNMVGDGSLGVNNYNTTVTDGLTLDGGKINLNGGPHLVFSGTETLSGTGTVTFANDNGTLGANTPNSLSESGGAGTTLT